MAPDELLSGGAAVGDECGGEAAAVATGGDTELDKTAFGELGGGVCVCGISSSAGSGGSVRSLWVTLTSSVMKGESKRAGGRTRDLTKHLNLRPNVICWRTWAMSDSRQTVPSRPCPTIRPS